MFAKQLVAALLFAGAAAAAPIVYTASLTGAAESPSNASTATGFTQVTLDLVAHSLRVQVSFTGLGSNTTASHIHCCTTTANTGIAGVATVTPTFTSFPLGVTSGSYDFTYDTSLAATFNAAFVTAQGSVAAAEAALAAGLASQKAYLNIHTANFTGGEIRGFLVQAPEPATLTSVGGLLVLVGLARRRRNS